MATLCGASPMEQLIDELDVRDELIKQRGHLVEDVILMLVDEEPNKMVEIGSNMCEENHRHLTFFLQANIDIFAWLASDMPDIDPEVIVHQLNMDSKQYPVKQKKRNFALERKNSIQEEIDKHLKVGFIREVYYPEWLANVILIKKINGK